MDESGNIVADRVLLRIADNGVGMTEEVLKKSMRPYFTTKERGNGVGSSVTAAIVRFVAGFQEICENI